MFIHAGFHALKVAGGSVNTMRKLCLGFFYLPICISMCSYVFWGPQDNKNTCNYNGLRTLVCGTEVWNSSLKFEWGFCTFSWPARPVQASRRERGGWFYYGQLLVLKWYLIYTYQMNNRWKLWRRNIGSKREVQHATTVPSLAHIPLIRYVSETMGHHSNSKGWFDLIWW